MSIETQQTVELQRSVRIGRLLLVGAAIGAVLGALSATLFPVPEGAFYSMGQIAGFMLLIGGIVGLTIGGVLALVLSAVAKRRRGTGVLEHTTVVGEGVEPGAGAAEAVAADAEKAEPEQA